MAKYTEAFCVTTGSMISIMQMRSEYNHDPAIYEKVYKGHLFCPGCQAVPLTVVHTNGQLYYRGHPHEEHADGCWYALDERVVKSVTEINGVVRSKLFLSLTRSYVPHLMAISKLPMQGLQTAMQTEAMLLLCISSKRPAGVSLSAVLKTCLCG